MSAPTKPVSLRERLDAVVSEAGPLQAAHDVVKAVPEPKFDVQRARAALVRELAAEVEQTGTWPDDAAERWAAVQRQADEAQALAEARQYVLGHFRAVTAEAHTDAAGPKLDVLRAELDEVLDEARDLDATLGPVHDADEAIRAGVAATRAWSALGVLVGRVREVLEMHRKLIAPSGLGDLAGTYAEGVPMPDAPEQDRAGVRGEGVDRATLRRIAMSEGVVHLPDLDELRQMHAARLLPPEGGHDLSPTVDTWDDERGGYTRQHTVRARR